METVTLKTHELDGKRVAYSSETTFYVQSGKGRKGSYQTRKAFKGNLALAVLWYNSLNIGNGYKKRLVSWDLSRPILARHFSD